MKDWTEKEFLRMQAARTALSCSKRSRSTMSAYCTRVPLASSDQSRDTIIGRCQRVNGVDEASRRSSLVNQDRRLAFECRKHAAHKAVAKCTRLSVTMLF